MSEHGDHDCNSIDVLLKQTRVNIDIYGLQVITVKASKDFPSFSYSVGLFETYEHPEVIVFGLSNELGHDIVNDVAGLVKKGELFSPGKYFDSIFRGSYASFLTVDPEVFPRYLATCSALYKSQSHPALQLVYPDQSGVFPWQEEFDERLRQFQPILDSQSDFRFAASKRTCVFTTREWVEEKMPIVQVSHDFDGHWQFLTEENSSRSIQLVALGELVSSDKTFNELFDLERGKIAERSFVGDNWTVCDIQPNES